MSCGCYTGANSDLAPGPTLYWPAGTDARWRLAVKTSRTGPALDLTEALEVVFVFKRSSSTADASALFTKRLTTGGIVATDLALGLVDVLVADTDTSAQIGGYPDWFYSVRVTIADGSVLQPFGLTGDARLDATAPTNVECLVAADPTIGTIAPVALTPAPLPTYATVAYVDAGILAAVTEASATNATGNTTITVPAGSRVHNHKITFSGSAGNRIVILDTANAAAGCVVRVDYVLPATASIVIELRNATSGGTLLDTLTTDTSADPAAITATLRAGAWDQDSIVALYPSA